MFGAGTQGLMEALPEFADLGEARVRRLLSGAWLEVVEFREFGTAGVAPMEAAPELLRLAVALQVHAVLAPGITPETVQACAFVAAEALDIARELCEAAEGDAQAAPEDIERVTVGLLYLLAGYDANARVSVAAVALDDEQPPMKTYALGCVIALLRGDELPDQPVVGTLPARLHERVAEALWRELGDLVAERTRWLRDPATPDVRDPDALFKLADALRLSADDINFSGHADIQHMARLCATAIDRASDRALREVVAPRAPSRLFDRFLHARCRTQPLIWPAAAEYARVALPGPSRSVVVTVPTGAGKSGIADLAIQHAVPAGWALYLAPTNALVGQIKRQLRADHPGVTVREFLGGAEYTTLATESLSGIEAGQVLVMTPEKCSLALREVPEAFESLALLIFDEAHLLGDHRGRGILSELVVAEILSRRSDVPMLFMSALIANPASMTDWLASIQDSVPAVVQEPWKPTRTLRAIVGLDRVGALAAAQPAGAELAALPPRRRNVSFDAPLGVLAGLRGAWSTHEPQDYARLNLPVTTPMKVTRPRNGGDITIDVSSAGVRPTVQALAQLLGGNGQKVMAFLPRSKHDSFAAALAVAGFDDVTLSPAVSALLDLSDAELGVASLLRDTLVKGVGVHTSALVDEERRASEIAFETDGAAVLFATGTLAQGLNLPATTVIVGGTAIGYAPEQSVADRQSQQRSQLLNAIGRAGRARVAARSLALVVPNTLPLLEDTTAADGILDRAEFLAEEDASTQIRSALNPFLSSLYDGSISDDELGPADHQAMGALSYAEGDRTGERILSCSWGAYQLGLVDRSRALLADIGQLSDQVLSSDDGFVWSREAARRAGVTLPPAALFSRAAVTLVMEGSPESLSDWLAALTDILRQSNSEQLSLLLDKNAFASTAIASCWSADANEHAEGFDALHATLDDWLNGMSLARVGGTIHGSAPITDNRRGQQSPIPRTIRVVNGGIAFGVTRAAGLLAATIDVATEEGAISPLSPESHAELERLPLAVRLGAADPVARAFLRVGVRPRAVAFLLAAEAEDPGISDDEALKDWATTHVSTLVDRIDDLGLSDSGTNLVAQFLVAREGS